MRPIDRLTPREAQLARMLGEGKAPRVIAAELDISRRTVNNMLYTVADKVGAHTITHLAVMVATGEIDLSQSQ